MHSVDPDMSGWCRQGGTLCACKMGNTPSHLRSLCRVMKANIGEYHNQQVLLGSRPVSTEALDSQAEYKWSRNSPLDRHKPLEPLPHISQDMENITLPFARNDGGLHPGNRLPGGPLAGNTHAKVTSGGFCREDGRLGLHKGDVFMDCVLVL